MNNFDNLEEWSPKELRKLRMNLNNRLESYKRTDEPRELAKSHMLHGLERGACEELLRKVKQAEKKQAFQSSEDDE